MRALLLISLLLCLAHGQWFDNPVTRWANENIVQPTAQAANRYVVQPTMQAAQAYNRHVIQPVAQAANRYVVQPTVQAAQSYHRNVLQPAANAIGQGASWAHRNIVQPVVRNQLRAANTVFAGGAAVGRGIDWAFDRAWDGVKWADRQTGVSRAVVNGARWANQQTGFTNHVSRAWQASGAQGAWNRMTAPNPNGQPGALSRAWTATANGVSRAYHGARNGYANLGESVGLTRQEMYRGFDNGLKTAATAAQFIPVGRVAGIGARAVAGTGVLRRVGGAGLEGLATRYATRSAAAWGQNALAGYARTQALSIASGQMRGNAIAEVQQQRQIQQQRQEQQQQRQRQQQQQRLRQQQQQQRRPQQSVNSYFARNTNPQRSQYRQAPRSNPNQRPGGAGGNQRRY